MSGKSSRGDYERQLKREGTATPQRPATPRAQAACGPKLPGLQAPAGSRELAAGNARARRAQSARRSACRELCVVEAAGGDCRRTFDPRPQGFSVSLSSAPLPGCVAQTFPACISHLGPPLFQAWDSRRGLRPSEVPTRQNQRFRRGKARG